MSSQFPKDYELVIPSILSKIQEVEDFTEKVTSKMNLNEEELDALAIAVTEVTNNAIIHGNKSDKRKKVIINYHLTKLAITITIKDEGAGFDPENISNPLAPENLLKESGRGIFIVKALLDEVSFHFNKGGTLVKLVKKKSN